MPASDAQLNPDFAKEASLAHPESEPKSGRSARIWRRLGLAALALFLASAAGLAALIYLADTEFVAGALSRLLGKHVEIGALAFRPGARLEIEIHELRVVEAPDSQEPPILEVEHAVGRQAWPRLLAGQLLPLDWVVERPVLRLHARSEMTPSAGFDLGRLPRLGLSLRDGEVSYQPRTGAPWIVRGLHLEAKRAGFGTRIEGEASGRVSRGAKALSELAIEFAADRKQLEVSGSVAELDLAALSEPSLSARGLANGSFALVQEYGDGALTGKLDVEVRKLSLQSADLSRAVAPARARLGLDLNWRGPVIELGLRPLALDDLVASGSVTLDTSSPGRIALDLELAPFEPGRRDRLNPLTLLGMKIDTWRQVAERIEAGTIEDIRLAIDVPRTTAGARLSFDTPLAPRAFALSLRARDGIYQPNPKTRLEKMSGELDIRGNVLAIRKLHMTDDGDPTPEIDVRIDGLDRLVSLPDDEDEVIGGPGMELAGLAAAIDGFRGDDASAAEPPGVRFSDLDLRYPAFVLPLRQATGLLRFPDGGVLAEGVTGVLGGAPTQLDVSWAPARDQVVVDIRYLAGVATGLPARGPRWLSGRIGLDALTVGDLELSDVDALLEAEGATARFSEISASLSGGALSGSGQVMLAERGRAPYDFDLEVHGFDVAPVSVTFGLPPEGVTGKGRAKGRLGGVLSRESQFSTDGTLALTVALENGTVSKLPALVALARLPSLSGVSGLLGRPLPYDSLTMNFDLADGRLAMSEGKLLGPQLRMLGSGEMDLNTPTKESDLVVALLFLQTLDSVIGSLPIVRNVVLGKDQNLLALYFRLDGPRDELGVTPLPPERLRDVVGFASSAVMSGVRTLGRLIPGSGDKSDETTAPSAPPP